MVIKRSCKNSKFYPKCRNRYALVPCKDRTRKCVMNCTTSYMILAWNPWKWQPGPHVYTFIGAGYLTDNNWCVNHKPYPSTNTPHWYKLTTPELFSSILLKIAQWVTYSRPSHCRNLCQGTMGKSCDHSFPRIVWIFCESDGLWISLRNLNCTRYALAALLKKKLLILKSET